MGSWFSLGRNLDRSHPFMRQFGARHALNLLSAINMLNFADRYVPSAVKQLIEDDLHLTDFQTALPVTGMVVVFMIFAVIFGVLSDKNVMDRRTILCGAVIFWSLATAAAGMAQNLTQLIAFRSLVGVGEAAYGTIAPPLISDFYPQHERGVAYGIYYLAIPIGGALGFGLGAVLGSAFGWRVSFFGCGLPGIAVAVLVLKICNPSRGVNDPVHPDSAAPEDKVNNEHMASSDRKDEKKMTTSQHIAVFFADIWEILRNPHFMLATLGQAANNFALGGLADWYATFMLRYCDVSLDTAGLAAGAATVIGGLGGTILGSKVADHYKTTVKSSYFIVPALFTIPAAVFLFLAINFPKPVGANLAFIFVGELFVWTNIAPVNSITITSIPPRLRSRASGVCIFVQHMLGDIISPPIIGAISDSTGSLKTAIQITWMAVLVSGICWWAGYAFCSPLDITLERDGVEDLLTKMDNNDSFEGSTVLPAPTYCALLCGHDLLMEDEHGRIVERTDEKASRSLKESMSIEDDARILS